MQRGHAVLKQNFFISHFSFQSFPISSFLVPGFTSSRNISGRTWVNDTHIEIDRYHYSMHGGRCNDQCGLAPIIIIGVSLSLSLSLSETECYSEKIENIKTAKLAAKVRKRGRTQGKEG